MRRKSNWPALLSLFLAEKRAQPFDWTLNNCAFFACDWLAILTGVDPAANYRGEISSALSAGRVLAAAGGLERIAEEACARWDWPEVPVARARRGDAMLIDTTHGPALGVCIGGRTAFAGSGGVVYHPALKCRRAWRIA